MSAIASSGRELWPWAAASVAVHGLLLGGLIILLPASIAPTDRDAGSQAGVEVELLPPAPDRPEPVAARLTVPEATNSQHRMQADAAAAAVKQAASDMLSMHRPSSEGVAEAKSDKSINTKENNPLNARANAEHEIHPRPDAPALAELSAPPQQREARPGAQDEAARRLAVRQRLEAFKHYPASARRRGIEGAVDVRFRLNAQGLAEDMQLLSGSGYRILDEAALDTVHRAEPFPVHGGTYRFRLRFTRS